MDMFYDYPINNEIEVSSSNLRKVAYDENNRLLFITFKSGNRYVYFNVPKEIYLQLVEADSKGKYFNTFIKNSFRFEKDIRV